MKVFTTVLVASALVAGVASAENPVTHWSNESDIPAATSAQIQVKADSVLTTKELHRAGLEAGDLLTITAFPTERIALADIER